MPEAQSTTSRGAVPGAAAAGGGSRRLGLALVVIATAQFMVVLDTTQAAARPGQATLADPVRLLAITILTLSRTNLPGNHVTGRARQRPTPTLITPRPAKTRPGPTRFSVAPDIHRAGRRPSVRPCAQPHTDHPFGRSADLRFGDQVDVQIGGYGRRRRAGTGY
jgi:hypothetical protein